MANQQERLVTIPGLNGYRISKSGRIYSDKSKNYLKPSLNKFGYYLVQVCVNGKSVKKPVHGLMAITFIPNLNKYRCVNHKNGCKTDNSVDNLEWCSFS